MDRKLIEAFQQFSREHGPEVALAHNGQQVIWFKRGKREVRPEEGSTHLFNPRSVVGL
jgi:hypothetical protein